MPKANKEQKNIDDKMQKIEQELPDEVIDEEDFEYECNQEAPSEDEAPPETGNELSQLKAQLKAESEKYLRLMAEYDNYRKRSIREKDGIYSDAQSNTISKFLTVYDNLELAIKTPTEDEAYAKGVEMTFSGLREVLDKLGVLETGEVGEVFDPEIHNAVMHIEDADLDDNTIAEVFQKGFKLGDRVIRHAMVKVAN